MTEKKFIYGVQCDICDKNFKIQYKRKTDVVCSDSVGNHLLWVCETCRKTEPESQWN